MQTTIRLSSKNQIVLPREAREAMHLKGRDELLVVVKDDVTLIMPKPKSYRAALSGAGAGVYPNPFEEGARSVVTSRSLAGFLKQHRSIYLDTSSFIHFLMTIVDSDFRWNDPGQARLIDLLGFAVNGMQIRS